MPPGFPDNSESPDAQPGDASPPPIRGPARVGRRTKDLVKRLRPGEIPVIDHADLDRTAAEDLIATQPAAVINAARSITGRFPNSGPRLLLEAGVNVVDGAGGELLDRVSDGRMLEIRGGVISDGSGELARGERMTLAEVNRVLAELRTEIDGVLAEFAENTVRHAREEAHLLAEGIKAPRTRTRFEGRHVLIVVRGPAFRSDLDALRGYIRDVRPVMIGVDGGADALLDVGFTPDLILGDMDSARDETLACGAELLVHGYSDGRAPGAARLEELGLEHIVIAAPGTSQDIAMMLADERGAELIVAVGSHFNLVEFLEKDRAGMSSTFLTRLRIGEKIVDAKGVSRLYRPAATPHQLGLIATAFVAMMIAVIAVSPPLENVADLVWLKIKVSLGI